MHSNLTPIIGDTRTPPGTALAVWTLCVATLGLVVFGLAKGSDQSPIISYLGFSTTASLLTVAWRLSTAFETPWRVRPIDLAICAFVLLAVHQIISLYVETSAASSVVATTSDMLLLLAAPCAVVATAVSISRFLRRETTRLPAICVIACATLGVAAVVAVVPQTNGELVARFKLPAGVFAVVSLCVWVYCLILILRKTRLNGRDRDALLIQIAALLFFTGAAYESITDTRQLMQALGLLSAIPLGISCLKQNHTEWFVKDNWHMRNTIVWFGSPALCLAIPAMIWVHVADSVFTWFGTVLTGFGIFTGAALIASVRLVRFHRPVAIPKTPTDTELNLLYQPIVRIRDGRIVGAEALLRNHRLKPVPLVVEQLGRSRSYDCVTEFILRRAFADGSDFLAHLGSRNFDAFVLINLSPWQLLKPNLLEQIDKALAQTKSKPEGFGFELTEQAVEASSAHIADRVAQLRRRGFLVVLDDFGAGHASLHTLAEIEFDIIKIDKSLVYSASSSRGERILERAVDICATCDAKIIVEGLETTEHTVLVDRLNVDYSQGHVSGSPMSMEDLLGLVDSHVVDTDTRQATRPAQPALPLNNDVDGRPDLAGSLITAKLQISQDG